ncbi:hypothetical protein DSO57_1003411 [Entomophthora muscae]|uniref:Uncharacterized protein n=1 Tax=Entomophthora muscae TaxID=34485 RepID=A0ACC2TK72_9FUNG|nr:hypothetical protein DSO57_1003411 [Entomophthora muscae]
MATYSAPSELQYWFSSVDTDNSGHLSAEELQKALANGDYTPFNIETVRLMVNMFDTDQSGTIGFPEFQALYQYIFQWQQCFRSFDRDQSNSIDRAELSTALHTFGFNISEGFVTTLVKQFNKHGGKKSKGYNGPESITFDNFIQICVTIRMLTESFRKFDNDSDGMIQIKYEDFLELVVTNK